MFTWTLELGVTKGMISWTLELGVTKRMITWTLELGVTKVNWIAGVKQLCLL